MYEVQVLFPVMKMIETTASHVGFDLATNKTS